MPEHRTKGSSQFAEWTTAEQLALVEAVQRFGQSIMPDFSGVGRAVRNAMAHPGAKAREHEFFAPRRCENKWREILLLDDTRRGIGRTQRRGENPSASDRAAELVERLREERKAQLRRLIAICDSDIAQIDHDLSLVESADAATLKRFYLEASKHPDLELLRPPPSAANSSKSDAAAGSEHPAESTGLSAQGSVGKSMPTASVDVKMEPPDTVPKASAPTAPDAVVESRTSASTHNVRPTETVVETKSISVSSPRDEPITQPPVTESSESAPAASLTQPTDTAGDGSQPDEGNRSEKSVPDVAAARSSSPPVSNVSSMNSPSTSDTAQTLKTPKTSGAGRGSKQLGVTNPVSVEVPLVPIGRGVGRGLSGPLGRNTSSPSPMTQPLPTPTSTELDDEVSSEDVPFGMVKKRNDAMLRIWKLVHGSDKAEPFKRPVTKREAPDYHTVIHVKKKLDKSDYSSSPREFINDMNLIFHNAMNYNLKGSEIWNWAKELRDLLRREETAFVSEFCARSLGRKSDGGVEEDEEPVLEVSRVKVQPVGRPRGKPTVSNLPPRPQAEADDSSVGMDEDDSPGTHAPGRPRGRRSGGSGPVAPSKDGRKRRRDDD